MRCTQMSGWLPRTLTWKQIGRLVEIQQDGSWALTYLGSRRLLPSAGRCSERRRSPNNLLSLSPLDIGVGVIRVG